METLRNLILSGLLIITFAIGGKSQDFAKIQTAFESSYSFEYLGKYSHAIDEIKKVYNEESYEINLRLGWLSYMGGFFTEATAYYQKAIDLKPLSIEAKFGYVYPASALGNWESVKTQYEEVLKVDPQNSLANYRLGSIYYGAEDYTSAYKYFELVVNLYPFDYDGLIMFAWTNLKLGKLREAEVLFNKALMNRPNDTSALEGLAEIK
jgi:tetratricopeptide (TPR) repeat protein